MYVFSFGRLDTYQEARKLVIDIYRIIDQLPKCEQFALVDQLRRAIVSVPSNIAEGCGRLSTKEKVRFIEIAYGSLMEVYCQIEICLDLKYISDEDFERLRPSFYSVSNKLNSLRNFFMKDQKS